MKKGFSYGLRRITCFKESSILNMVPANLPQVTFASQVCLHNASIGLRLELVRSLVLSRILCKLSEILSTVQKVVVNGFLTVMTCSLTMLLYRCGSGSGSTHTPTKWHQTIWALPNGLTTKLGFVYHIVWIHASVSRHYGFRFDLRPPSCEPI
jgi:hypothetical protein